MEPDGFHAEKLGVTVKLILLHSRIGYYVRTLSVRPSVNLEFMRFAQAVKRPVAEIVCHLNQISELLSLPATGHLYTICALYKKNLFIFTIQYVDINRVPEPEHHSGKY
jgi:hypothetical protein